MKYGTIQLVSDYDENDVYGLIEQELEKHGINAVFDSDRAGEMVTMETDNPNPPKTITITIELGEWEDEEDF